MKLSLQQLKSVVAAYVASNKISVDTYTATHDNTIGLLDQIAKIFTLETSFVDKLALFDGEELSYGKGVEEWAADLILPEDYNTAGTDALGDHSSTYRPVSYSFTLGRKKIAQTIKNDDIEKAVHNEAQFAEIITSKTKALYDSETALKYSIKRQALGELIGRCDTAMNTASMTALSATSNYSVGDFGKYNNKPYQVVKAYTASTESSVANMEAKGYIVEMDVESVIAKPVDTATGEAFIEQLKKDVEVAGDISQGHSLNGGCLGASPAGLVLVVLQGIIPNLEVNTQAGAFHLEKIAIPAEVVSIPDFGNYSGTAYAILMDRRGMKLFNSYRAVREQINGDGDWTNLFFHTENTAHISKNTFVKVYKAS